MGKIEEKCTHELGDVQKVEWLNMSIRFCEKCKHYEFAYQEELQKNIEMLSGYNGQIWT